jgi:Flp pilus assembly pilin Flp
MASGRASDDDMTKSDVRRAAPPARSAGGFALGFKHLKHSEEGQTMAEYAIVIAVITPALILLFAAMSGAIAERLQAVVGFLG